jgi:dihydrolipoamide dehydrogenase
MVMGDMEMSVELLVIGGGPAGQAAALEAAARGIDVCLIEPETEPGRHRFMIREFHSLYSQLAKVRLATAFTDSISLSSIFARMTKACENKLAAQAVTDRERILHNNILLLSGRASFIDAHTVRLVGAEVNRLRFKYCIIATGTVEKDFQGTYEQSEKIVTTASALDTPSDSTRILVVGGGLDGLEIGCLLSQFGNTVELVEQHESVLPEADNDLVRILLNRSQLTFRLQTCLTRLQEQENGVEAFFTTTQGPKHNVYDHVILAGGREADTRSLNLNAASITPAPDGSLTVNAELRTEVPHIFAIGGVTNPAQQTHTGIYQGRIAAEIIAGKHVAFEPVAVPTIVCTLPPLAWCGLTEKAAKKKHIEYQTQRYFWPLSAQEKENSDTAGLTKLLLDPVSSRILGAGIVGDNSLEAVGEMTFAIEMAAFAEDLAHSIHPQGSVAATLAQAAATRPTTP